MARPTVLVTGGGTQTALSVMKGLRLEGGPEVRVVLGDPSEDIAGRQLADGFVRLPPADAPDLVDRVLAIALAEQAAMVVPIFDLELEPLAEARERFQAAGIRLAIGPPASVALCRDKRATATFLAEHDLPAPQTWTPDEALRLGGDAYPLFVKPWDGRGSLDARRVDDRSALERALEGTPRPMVQELVEGREVTIDTVSDVHGVLQGACARWREVVKAGQSFKGTTFLDPGLLALCRRLCDALGMTGPACLQAFATDRGYRFIEINPRFGAASILSMRAGLNGPRWLLHEALGLPLPALAPRAGLRMLRYWEETYVEENT